MSGSHWLVTFWMEIKPGPRPNRLTTSIAIILMLLAVAGTWLLADRHARLAEPVDFSRIDYVGSQTCRDCHDDRHASWSATFHRTMTQQAGVGSIQGQFDGRPLDFQGIRVRPIEQQGRYYFEYSDLASGTHLNRLRIMRTVGSNRYQQYLARIDEQGTYARLHWLWHNGDQRWVHMNAAFLGPDGQDFDQHVAIWNQNCIFCHNTGIVPGLLNEDELRRKAAAGESVNMSLDGRFSSSVAEMGISCESCHGPGQAHVERADGFVTRQTMRLFPGIDTSIFNPVRDPLRGSQICGQCHAQRIPSEPGQILQWMREGPGYRPGDDLLAHVTPVHRDLQAPVSGQEDMFRDRFWGDGSPRLTAYEYQGMRMSAGHQRTDLSCMDCHTMHAGDPSGQITDRQRGDAPCLRCHTDYRDDRALAGHTRHLADSPGARCYSCHMPELVYGVMDIHRSHRIESPDALRDLGAGRPNACLNCHLDQSPQWATEQLALHWNGATTLNPERIDGGDPALAEVATMLFGDPVQKAITAWRTGRPDSAGTGLDEAWKVPWLLAAMADNYPSTRRFARNSLLQVLARWSDPDVVSELASLAEEFDFIAPAQQRRRVLQQAGRGWTQLDKSLWPLPPPATGLNRDYSIPEPLLRQLVKLGRRQDKQIHIGE